MRHIILLTIILSSKFLAVYCALKINNVRQLRRIDYVIRDQEDVKMSEFLVNFIAKFDKELIDHGEKCDEAKHQEWFYSGTKDLLSSQPKISFVLEQEWRGQICNFFKLLDCINGICECDANGPNSKYKLNIAHFPKDSPTEDIKPHKEFVKHKRRCRALENELCNIVVLDPNTFPVVPLKIPIYLECEPNHECKVDTDKEPEPNSPNPTISQRCVPHKGNNASFLTLQSPLIIVLLIAVFVSY